MPVDQVKELVDYDRALCAWLDSAGEEGWALVKLDYGPGFSAIGVFKRQAGF